jgi:hypothetical protein
LSGTEGFTKSDRVPRQADRRWQGRSFNHLAEAVKGFREVIARGDRNLFLVDSGNTVFMVSVRAIEGRA